MARPLNRKNSRRQFVHQLRIALTLAMAMALIFLVVVQISVADAFRNRQPTIALSLVPFDAQARAKLAAAVSESSKPGAREAAVGLAHDALRRDALSPDALRALANALKNDPGQADRAAAIMAQSDKLSRRDLQTQLWLVQYYLQRDDTTSVMRHFDNALRTTSSAQSALFPLLALASEDRRIAHLTVERLRQRPAWAEPFFLFLLQETNVNPETAAQLARNSLDPATPGESEVLRNFISKFAAAEEYDLAWDLYERFFSKDRGRGQTLLDGGFERKSGVGPIGWSLTQESKIWSELEPRPGGSGVVLRLVAAGRGGTLARQLLHLPPGGYRLSAVVGDVPSDIFERPEVNVVCTNGGAILTTVKAQKSGAAAQTVSEQFTIPLSCKFQWLTITLAGDGTETGENPWIDDVAIVPVR